jgi:putative Mg2+ transporter-C (MgtC) family protein
MDPIVQSQIGVVLTVGGAMLLGALVGLDRELAEKPAGLRTHMLVAGASALLVSMNEFVVRAFGVDDALINTDPIRIIEAVVTGVSFLGAGTIIRRRAGSQVEGLTTAASLLFVAGVGVAVALSQWIVAIGATLLVLITLRGLGYLELRRDRMNASK